MFDRRRLRALLPIAVVLTATPLRSQVARDSAGIQIVENARPSLPGGRAWRIDPLAIVTIGESAGSDTMYELELVMGITRLRDGRYAVGVQASNAVRFYDAQGKFVSAAGRRGQGPGEFRQIMGVRPMRGDTLVVTDLGEVEMYSGDGKFVAQGASRSRGDRFVYPELVLSDGSYLGRLYHDFAAPPPAGRRRESLPVVHVSRDGALLDTIARVLSNEQVYDGRQQWGMPVAYSGYSYVAGDDQRIFVNSPTSLDVSEFNRDGKLTRLIRQPHPPVRTSAEAKQAFRAWYLAMPGETGRPMPPQMKAQLAEQLERTQFADELPTFAHMIVDKAGNLWVQRYDYRLDLGTPGPARTQTMTVPTHWNVHDAGGRWLCVVELPARFTPVEIGADYIAGLGRNIDDVEQVRVYRLRKP